MSRAYKSELRKEQQQQTRQRILEALVDELAAGGDDFAIGRVAERAGVSVRTVYHHFPDRESQIEAVAAWLDDLVGEAQLPKTAAELPAYGRRRYLNFFAHERLMRAQLNSGVASEVRKRRRRRSEAAIDACLQATGAPADDVRMAAAMVKSIIGAKLGVQLTDDYRLDRERALAVGEWTVGLIVAALERKKGPSAYR
jgi:AcrR family transcriptional regulator